MSQIETTSAQPIEPSHALDAKQQAQIKSIVCEILELDESEVSHDSLFKEDHGADSLRAIEILAALEREFDVEIGQDELARMVNLDGIYAVLTDAGAGAP
jgi:acyl carrier protein